VCPSGTRASYPRSAPGRTSCRTRARIYICKRAVHVRERDARVTAAVNCRSTNDTANFCSLHVLGSGVRALPLRRRCVRCEIRPACTRAPFNERAHSSRRRGGRRGARGFARVVDRISSRRYSGIRNCARPAARTLPLPPSPNEMRSRRRCKFRTRLRESSRAVNGRSFPETRKNGPSRISMPAHA